MKNVLSDEERRATVRVFKANNNNVSRTAKALGLPRQTIQHRLKIIEREGVREEAGFEVEPLPAGDEGIEALLDRRERKFVLKDQAAEARKLIHVKIKTDGPIGICHFGDPHVDDDGCDIPYLRRTIDLVKSTNGMFAANVGDLQNNWIGRLSHLWAKQSTSAQEAWQLTEWLVNSLDWLYLVGGNHDAWSGEGDPLKWMMRDQIGVFDYNGVRLSLDFPNGKSVIINCRHDFRGHSQWNNTHGPLKAAMLGWRDHILTCGHKHESGYQVTKDPLSGRISHIIRVAGFKKHDSYAKELGLPDQSISPTATTIIDPTEPDDSPELVTVIHGIEKATGYLKYLRGE